MSERKERGGFGKFFSNFLFQEEVSGQTTAAQAGTAPAVSVSSAATRATIASSVDPAMTKRLLEEVDKFTPQPYKGFTALLESLSVIPDEMTRLQAAFQAAKKTQGLTFEVLLRAAQDRLRLLDREKAEFEAELDTGLVKPLEVKKGKHKEACDQLTSLQLQLKAVQGDVQSLEEEIKMSEEKIVSSRQSFDQVFQAAQAAINSDVNKIQSLNSAEGGLK